MSKKLCITKRITGLEGRLEYYLTKNRYEDIKNGISTFVFGVEIQKVTVDEKNIELIQRKAVTDLSVEKEKVVEFLYMLSDMEVMPVSLEDIVGDFIEEDFFINSRINEKSA